MVVRTVDNIYYNLFATIHILSFQENPAGIPIKLDVCDA